MKSLNSFLKALVLITIFCFMFKVRMSESSQQTEERRDNYEVGGSVTLDYIVGEPWNRSVPAPSALPIHDMTAKDVSTAWAVGDSGTILGTTDGGDNWVIQRSPKRVDLRSITTNFETKLWICGDQGSILATDDAGISWQVQSSGLTTDLYCIQFIDSLNGWAVGEKSSILHTNDGGHFWKLMPQISDIYDRHLRGLYFITDNEGWVVGGGTSISSSGYFIYHTMDSGQTWTEQKRSSSGRYLESIYFVDNQKGWAVGQSGNAFKTADGGVTWSSFSPTSGIREGTAYYIGIKFLDHDRGFIWGWIAGSGLSSGKKYLLLKTPDAGETWNDITPEPYCEKTEDFYVGAVAAASENLLWAGCTRGIIYQTSDGGQEWNGQTAATAIDFKGISFGDRDNGWAVGDYGIIAHTDNGGMSWRLQKNKLTTDITLQDVYFIDALNGWAVGNRGTILHTNNAGQTWDAQYSGTNSDIFAVWFVDEKNGWLVGADGLIKHTNLGGNGNSWEVQNSGVATQLNDVHFYNGRLGYVVGNNGTFLRSSDAGQNWEKKDTGTSSNHLSIYFCTEKLGHIVGEGWTRMLRSANGGDSWGAFSGVPNSALHSVRFADADQGWIVGA